MCPHKEIRQKTTYFDKMRKIVYNTTKINKSKIENDEWKEVCDMNEKTQANQFYRAFQAVDYPCFWLEKTGCFWMNDVATAIGDTDYGLSAIKRLLRNLAGEIASKKEELPQLNLPITERVESALHMLGAEVLVHPNGLFVVRQGEARMDVLSQALREPISDLFSSVQALSRRLEHCRLSESDETFVEECLLSMQKKEYTLLRLAYNLEVYHTFRTKSSFAREKELELHGFVENLCKKAQRAFLNSHVSFRTELEEGMFIVKGDPRLLAHAITNLLRNSLQFTREGNCVTVRLKRLKNRVMLSVVDEGLGIRTEALPYVFTPYYSASPYLDTQERPGLGLGLTLVHGATKAMGGVVTIESEFGKGTSVHLSLPQSAQPTQSLKSYTAEDDEDFFADSQSPVNIQLCGYLPPPVL